MANLSSMAVFKDEYDHLTRVGSLYESVGGFTFSYELSYLEDLNSVPIYSSLPLEERVFDEEASLAAFGALLPEGRRRQDIARELGISAYDDFALLEALGSETLGALIFSIEQNPAEVYEAYEEAPENVLKDFINAPYRTASNLARKVRLSLAGEMAKIGLYIHPETKKVYLPLGIAPSTHIIKASRGTYPNQTLNEALCLLTARNLGFTVPEFELQDIWQRDPIIIMQRYDRPIPNDPIFIDECPRPIRLHQEDFCQALGIVSEYKYQEDASANYAGRMAQVLTRVAPNVLTETQKLVSLLLFHHFIGDCDGHLKNYGMLRAKDFKTVALAPIYDVTCTTVYDDLSTDEGIRFGDALTIEDVDRDDLFTTFLDMGVTYEYVEQQLDFFANNMVPALTDAFEEFRRWGYADFESMYARIAEGVEGRLNKTSH